MKILFAYHSPLLVGAERSLFALNIAARNRGADVIAVVPPKHGPLLDKLNEENVPILRCPNQWWMGLRSRGFLGLVRSVQALAQTGRWWFLYRCTKPDLVIVGSTVTPAPLLGAKLSKVATVTLLSESIQTNPTLPSTVPKSLIRHVISRCSTFSVAVSNFVANQYVRPTTILPPALEVRFSSELPGYKQRDPREPLRCVMLGTLSWEKGQVDAVEACLSIASRADIELSLYGYPDDPSVERAIASLAGSSAKASEVFQLFGPTDDPLGKLADADLAIVCSKNEAYGRVTAEALFVGTPVLAYSAGATPEILAAGGGILVAPNSSSLADALLALASEESRYERLKADALGRARTRADLMDGDTLLTRILEVAEDNGEGHIQNAF